MSSPRSFQSFVPVNRSNSRFRLSPSLPSGATPARDTGSTVASITYGYDADDNLTAETTSSAFAGASANTYTYDEANRLTSWDNRTTTTSYAYDGDGNRTQAGNTTYTYDARDELTSDGTSTYAYTADGDLSSVTNTATGTVTTSTSDAYGQQGQGERGQGESAASTAGTAPYETYNDISN